MSKINRYNFARNYYKKYAIILLDKHKLYVYEDNKYKEYYTKYSLNKIMDEVLNKYKEGMK